MEGRDWKGGKEGNCAVVNFPLKTCSDAGALQAYTVKIIECMRLY